MSVPTRSPVDSSSGISRSRVVPGYVVDSSTISWPGWSTWASALPAASSGPRSGSRFWFSGVGTQRMTASALARSA